MSILLLKAASESYDDGGDPYVTCFIESGLEVKVVDVIDFEYMNCDSLRLKIDHPEGFGGLIFTSPRSVMAVKQCMKGGLLKTDWSNLPSYVVGESTSKVLQRELGLIGVGSVSGNAEHLASFILKDVAGKQMKPLLFPGSEQRSSVLPKTLELNNVPVDIISSYRTISHPKLNERLNTVLSSISSKIEILVFFSPSGVSSVLPVLCNLKRNLGDFKMVAIGPSTEQALTKNGLPVFATASNPSPTGLVDSIKSALGVR